jgi:hypothetical protein
MALSQTSSSSSSHSQQLPIISTDHLPSTLHRQPSPSVAAQQTSPLRSASSPTDPTTAAALSNQTLNRPQHRHSTKSSRSGLLTLAALARDRTTSAIASLSEPSVRPRLSSGSLYRTAQSSPTSPPYNSNNSKSLLSTDSQASNLDRLHNSAGSKASTPTNSRNESTISNLLKRQSLLETNPPSQAYSNTASDTPAPISFVPSGNHRKMHQTSSRLLRMTSDDRPFTRVSNTCISTN